MRAPTKKSHSSRRKPSVFAVLPSSTFLPVENPYVFAVLFEAAKAKFPQCNNRACLAKNAIAFFACNARPPTGYIRAEPLCAFSLVRFFDACQRNEQKTYMPISLSHDKEIGERKRA